MDKTGFVGGALEMRINRIMNSRKEYMGVHYTDQYLQPLLTLNTDPEVRSSQVCLKKAYSAVNLARENRRHFSTTPVSPRNDLILFEYFTSGGVAKLWLFSPLV